MSHESDGTDDELETTSFNAFEMTDERQQSWHGQIEVSSPQLKPTMKRSASDIPSITPGWYKPTNRRVFEVFFNENCLCSNCYFWYVIFMSIFFQVF